MLLRALSFMFATGLLAFAPGVAAAQTAHQHDGGCCKTEACCHATKMACCKAQPDPVAVKQIANRPEPSRQTMTVWFHKPVKIGDRILLGQYVIEHDNVRMARNQPCTHIYAASDQRLPVVAFHCTHLKRARGEQPIVVLRPLGEPNGMRAFAEFQFAGEDASHGVPTGR